MTSSPWRWTNESVLRFAESRGPVEAVTERAREVVVAAMDEGWEGPPFDPFELADHLKIDIAPRHDVSDAQTVPAARDRLRIEFNPNRPRGRLRYSVAHEIAHTLFDDCGERIRHRGGAHVHTEDDEWQLEALCNIAAAEFLMPVGSFPELTEEDLVVEHLVDLRRRYDVSVEALLIRAARLTESPCAVFTAHAEEHGPRARYRVDYAIPSRSWPQEVPAGIELPADSVVSECTAIGFTAKRQEAWPGADEPWTVECVGLPPYPGRRIPRVAGLIHGRPELRHRSGIQFLKGDATQPRERPAVIGQIVNDKTPNWGGNGFARAVRTTWPDVQEVFRAWASDQGLELGTVHVTRAEPDIWVASMVAQRGYGESVRPRVRYAALRRCLAQVATHTLECDATLHLPRIGCGEGGGDWSVVQELIVMECVRRGIDVTVYDLPDAEVPKATQMSLELLVS